MVNFNKKQKKIIIKRFGPFFVTPIVAGLENGKVILASYDSIGCISIDTVAVGGYF